MTYRAPLAEFRFLLDHIVDFDAVCATQRYAECDSAMTQAVLDEAARLCEQVLDPLHRVSDTEGARLENGTVRTPAGYAQAYGRIASGGWIGMTARPEHGGMGMPQTLASLLHEMMASGCLALQLNPLLTQGQIEALEHHASPEIQALYMPKLIDGTWSGTMNLTEPQAGSDLAALACRAEPLDSERYAITGQKIYISWGDTDFTENVCHLVLARLPDAPAGVRGISLFMVPKLLPNPDGSVGPQNSLRVLSLEHKMGLHGSPTAVMAYDGATGWLVGEPNGGLAAMFTMMNRARLAVGVQGLGVAERAWQEALAYARERVQGGGPIAIHADVRRMLATMEAELFAARALALACSAACDMAEATGTPDWAARAALLTPLAKVSGSETGSRLADLSIQIHGGMGYIEETGAAQLLRDVRVTEIYEGTNGIQAVDLVGRKMADGGAAVAALLAECAVRVEAAADSLPDLAAPVAAQIAALREVTEELSARAPADRLAGALPYLRAMARVVGGVDHLRAAVADPARRTLAAYYIEALLPETGGLLAQAIRTPDDLPSYLAEPAA